MHIFFKSLSTLYFEYFPSLRRLNFPQTSNEQSRNHHSYISSPRSSISRGLNLYDVHNISVGPEWPPKHASKVLIWNGRIRSGRKNRGEILRRSKAIIRGDNADTWRAALTIESPTESFPGRMISFPWCLEPLREAAYVPKVCIDAINARVKPVSRSSAILRYATFLGIPQRTSLHSLSLRTILPQAFRIKLYRVYVHF